MLRNDPLFGAVVRIMHNRKNRRNRTRKRCVRQFLRSRLLRFAKRESRMAGNGGRAMGKIRYSYYNDKGEKRGGFSGKEIKALAKSGLISPDTIIETEDGKKYRAGGVEGMEFRNTDTAIVQDSSIIIPSTVQAEFQPVPIPQPLSNKIPAVPVILIGIACGLVAAVLMLCVVWAIPDHTLSDMKNVLADTQRKLGQAVVEVEGLKQDLVDVKNKLDQAAIDNEKLSQENNVLVSQIQHQRKENEIFREKNGLLQEQNNALEKTVLVTQQLLQAKENLPQQDDDKNEQGPGSRRLAKAKKRLPEAEAELLKARELGITDDIKPLTDEVEELNKTIKQELYYWSIGITVKEWNAIQYEDKLEIAICWIIRFRTERYQNNSTQVLLSLATRLTRECDRATMGLPRESHMKDMYINIAKPIMLSSL